MNDPGERRRRVREWIELDYAARVEVVQFSFRYFLTCLCLEERSKNGIFQRLHALKFPSLFEVREGTASKWHRSSS